MIRIWGLKFASSLLLMAAVAYATDPKETLPHEAYIWQRAWNDSVVEAVTNHGAAFSNLVVLRSEIAWRNGTPDVIPARVNYSALAATHRPVGIALRIGGYAGPFS